MASRKKSSPAGGALATRIVRLPLADLELLELNARFMRHETYAQLVTNLQRDGALTSVPFACLNQKTKRYRVLSGNHRVRAAIDAGIAEAEVMVTDDPLDEQRQVALQLAHNAIAGEDDPAVLKQLYDRLDEIDWRVYSGLDDKTLDLFEKVDVGGLTEARLDWQTIAFLFLPEQADEVEAAFEAAKEELVADRTWLASRADYDRLLDSLAEAGAAHGVKNQATALHVMLGIFDRHRDELAEGWLGEDGEAKHKNAVPVSSILGTDRIPAGLAVKLRKALEQIAGRKEIGAGELWKALEDLVDG